MGVLLVVDFGELRWDEGLRVEVREVCNSSGRRRDFEGVSLWSRPEFAPGRTGRGGRGG